MRDADEITLPELGGEMVESKLTDLEGIFLGICSMILQMKIDVL